MGGGLLVRTKTSYKPEYFELMRNSYKIWLYDDMQQHYCFINLYKIVCGALSFINIYI